VFSLSLLIQSNNKRVSYYKSAAERAVDPELKALMLECAEQSQSYSDDLIRWVKAYGATPAPLKKTIATTAWDKLKELLMMDTAETLPVTSGAIEEETLKVYKTALSLSFLPGTAIKDIRKHVSDFEKSREAFKGLNKLAAA
jgi:uncharacterized protein (TIGR02284 family)